MFEIKTYKDKNKMIEALQNCRDEVKRKFLYRDYKEEDFINELSKIFEDSLSTADFYMLIYILKNKDF